MAYLRKNGRSPEHWDEAQLDKLADIMLDYFENNPNAYVLSAFIADPANKKWRFSLEDVHEFKDRSVKFKKTYKAIHSILENRLVNHGLNPQTRSPAMAMFILKCKNHWQDTIKVENNTTGSINLNIQYNVAEDKEYE